MRFFVVSLYVLRYVDRRKFVASLYTERRTARRRSVALSDREMSSMRHCSLPSVCVLGAVVQVTSFWQGYTPHIPALCRSAAHLAAVVAVHSSSSLVQCSFVSNVLRHLRDSTTVVRRRRTSGQCSRQEKKHKCRGLNYSCTYTERMLNAEKGLFMHSQFARDYRQFQTILNDLRTPQVIVCKNCHTVYYITMPKVIMSELILHAAKRAQSTITTMQWKVERKLQQQQGSGTLLTTVHDRHSQLHNDKCHVGFQLASIYVMRLMTLQC